MYHGCPKDHPRRCGENESEEQTMVKAKGSPPQVRGKLANLVAVIGGMRITPAGAGKTAMFPTADSGE